MPTIEKISLAGELRRIAAEMDRAGMNPDPRVVYCTSKYDSDLILAAAKALESKHYAPQASDARCAMCGGPWEDRPVDGTCRRICDFAGMKYECGGSRTLDGGHGS